MPNTAPENTDATPHLDVKPKTLAMIAGGGLLAGTLIVVGAIMPAEFNVDPLGIGKLTGVSRLWAPDETTFEGGGPTSSTSAAAPSRLVVEIPLGAADWPEAAVEYKVRMTPGQAILYRWTAFKSDGSPVAEPVEYDTHGHNLVGDGDEMTVVQMEKDSALEQHGSIAAPMDGIFGWYFRNHDPDPVTIRVEIEGYYAVVPPGEPGNEFGIRPLDPS